MALPRRGVTLVRREMARSAAWSGPLALLLLSCSAAAQNLANWNTTAGNWNTAANWDCVVNHVSSHCVPVVGFNVMTNGGTVTPGDATGTMSITGNYSQSAGVLLFEIDGLGPSQYDHLVISGLADITGGSIDIQFGNGFLPAAGESFDLVSAALGLHLANVNFDLIGLPSNLQFTETVGANGFGVSFGPASGSAPEPGTPALIALGGLSMLALRWKAVSRILKSAGRQES